MPRGGKRPGLTAIYALSGACGEIRYIGKSVDPKNRLSQHVSAAQTGSSNKDRWLKKVHARGDLQMTILEWVEDWQAAERRWIADGRAQGWRLFNIAEGGDDPTHFRTPQSRAKWRGSPFRKVMTRLVQVSEEARRAGMDHSYRNMRECITQFRKTAAWVKRHHGEDGFYLWSWWFYSQFPMHEKLPPEQEAWLARVRHVGHDHARSQ